MSESYQFREQMTSHILHDCLYVRLRWGDEHQGLLHDKHLVGKDKKTRYTHNFKVKSR